MKTKNITAIVIIVVCLCIFVSIALAAQDRFTLKAPNGIAFLEFRGYETWQDVAPSQTDDGLKAILGNATMINAYKEGIPGKFRSSRRIPRDSRTRVDGDMPSFCTMRRPTRSSLSGATAHLGRPSVINAIPA